MEPIKDPRFDVDKMIECPEEETSQKEGEV